MNGDERPERLVAKCIFPESEKDQTYGGALRCADAQTAQLKIHLKSSFIHSNPHLSKYFATRSLGAFWTTTSIWRPFGPAFLPFGHSLGKYQSQVV